MNSQQTIHIKCHTLFFPKSIKIMHYLMQSRMAFQGPTLLRMPVTLNQHQTHWPNAVMPLVYYNVLLSNPDFFGKIL